MSSVALVSMPWMLVNMPSIQLATLAATLDHESIESRSYELFVDYAATIGLNLYGRLCDAGGFIEEWLFARQYYQAELGVTLDQFREQRPDFGIGTYDMQDEILDALIPVTEGFVRDIAADSAWRDHDIVGMSLTISQNAPSMALARELKLRHPHLTIVFGGSGCAGPMGPAQLRACPYVDAVVSVEGELVFAELIRRFRASAPIDDLAGVWSRSGTEVVGSSGGPVHEASKRSRLAYNDYFARLERTGLTDRIQVWLPFESSRGCWWGEKHQCTFCGLHEIMAYRENPAEPVLAELEALERHYGIARFFAVDLIMPRDYLRTLLPEIQRRAHSWSLFYEVKANLKRDEVATLAAAGVRWIQPGIESLDDAVLVAMRKGVTALQNIQLLKWTAEHDVRTSWSIIVGLPGEDPGSYDRMIQLMPLLHHLTPPSHAATFQLHRFSPYFEDPDQWGIEHRGALPIYRSIFPVDDELLNDLVYRHAYTVEREVDVESAAQSLQAAITKWHEVAGRGAALTFRRVSDGSATIIDSRTLPEQTFQLTVAEAAVYELLDPACTPDQLMTMLQVQAPTVVDELATEGVLQLLERWEAHRLLLRMGERVFSLALSPPASSAGHEREDDDPLPVPYLESLPRIPSG